MNELMDMLSTKQDDFFLKFLTKDLKKFESKELVRQLKLGYESEDSNIVRSSTLFNALFTQRTLVFSITTRSFAKLVANDKLSRYKNCAGSEYKLMLKKIINSGFVKRLREPKNGKAGLYEVVQPSLIEFMKEIYTNDVETAYNKAKDFKTIFEEKKQIAIDYWENFSNETKGKEGKKPRVKDFDIKDFRSRLESKLNKLQEGINE